MTEGEFQKQLKKYHETGEMPVELAVKLLSECAMDCVYEEETEEAKFMAIKALEQEPCEDATLKDIFCMGCEYKEQKPILDNKIRDEIARLRDSWEKDNYHDEADALTTALAIFDKYKVQEGKS